MMRSASLWLCVCIVTLSAMCAGCRNHNRDIIRVAVDGLNTPQVAAQILVVPGIEGFKAELDGDSLVMRMRVSNACVLNTTDPQIMVGVMSSTLQSDPENRDLVEAIKAEGVWLVVDVTDSDGATVAHAAMSPDDL